MTSIRKFSLKDLDQVLVISKSSFKQVWPRSGFEDNYLKYPDEFIVAEDEGQVAGFVLGKISDGRGLIKLVAVSPDHRGKGIGKNLMEYIFNHFTEKGVKEVIAHSRMRNKEGCAFLKNCGFEIAETLEKYYQNGEDAYLMVKKLDG